MTQINQRENYNRVTNILYPFSGLEKIPSDVLANAAQRGTKVHNICEGIISGLGELGVDHETKPYVESFKQWWEDGHTVVKMEERFYDDELKLTGQVDLILDTPEGLAVVDLKTSRSPGKTWPAQGSAYGYLARKAGYDIKKIYFVHLLRTGKLARVIEYPADDSFFLSIFRVWKHFYEPKTKQS